MTFGSFTHRDFDVIYKLLKGSSARKFINNFLDLNLIAE